MKCLSQGLRGVLADRCKCVCFEGNTGKEHVNAGRHDTHWLCGEMNDEIRV